MSDIPNCPNCQIELYVKAENGLCEVRFLSAEGLHGGLAGGGQDASFEVAPRDFRLAKRSRQPSKMVWLPTKISCRS